MQKKYYVIVIFLSIIGLAHFELQAMQLFSVDKVEFFSQVQGGAPSHGAITTAPPLSCVAGGGPQPCWGTNSTEAVIARAELSGPFQNQDVEFRLIDPNGTLQLSVTLTQGSPPYLGKYVWFQITGSVAGSSLAAQPGLWTVEAIAVGGLSNAGSHFAIEPAILQPPTVGVSSPYLFATDYQGNHVKVYDSNLNLLNVFGSLGSGLGQFIGATGIAVDQHGRVYVGDQDNNRIQVFDLQGQPISPFQWSITKPQGISVDCESKVYVISGNEVYVFDGWNGKLINKWGGMGNSNGEFLGPNDVEVSPDGQRVHVTDTGNSRVQVFTQSGTFLFQFGSFGTTQNQFRFPTGITLDSLRNIYVADTSNQMIKKFDPNGHLIQSGGIFVNPQGNSAPQGLAIGSQGSLYHADWFDSVIRELDQSLNIVRVTGGPGLLPTLYRNPSDVATQIDCLSKTCIKSFDLNNNRVIDGIELIAAVDAWVDGQLGDDCFFDIVDAWVTQKLITSSSAHKTIYRNLYFRISKMGSLITVTTENPNVISTQIDVFSLNGSTVFSDITNGNQINWNLMGYDGSILSNGVYLYRVMVQDYDGNIVQSEVRKLAVLR